MTYTILCSLTAVMLSCLNSRRVVAHVDRVPACSLTPTPLHHTQLRNKGEQGDKTYAEAVPWLEAANFGGFLATREVMNDGVILGRVFSLSAGIGLSYILMLNCFLPTFYAAEHTFFFLFPCHIVSESVSRRLGRRLEALGTGSVRLGSVPLLKNIYDQMFQPTVKYRLASFHGRRLKHIFSVRPRQRALESSARYSSASTGEHVPTTRADYCGAGGLRRRRSSTLPL